MKKRCLHCGIAFTPHRRGHVFCSSFCRHRGVRAPEERERTDHEQVARLVDERRDPEARARGDDWHPTPHLPWVELDHSDTVETRRQWYVAILERPS